VVRVQRLYHKKDSLLQSELSCPHNINKGVTNESILQIKYAVKGQLLREELEEAHGGKFELMCVKIRSRYKRKKITTGGKEMELFNNNIFLKDIIFMCSRVFDLIVCHVYSMSYAISEE
jgi:hypothetical protein